MEKSLYTIINSLPKQHKHLTRQMLVFVLKQHDDISSI